MQNLVFRVDTDAIITEYFTGKLDGIICLGLYSDKAKKAFSEVEDSEDGVKRLAFPNKDGVKDKMINCCRRLNLSLQYVETR